MPFFSGENVTIIIAALGFLSWSYRKGNSRLEEWRDEYFTEVLCPFIAYSRQHENMNMKEFLDEIHFHDKFCVPSYVLKLVEGERHDELRKILIVDYCNMMPSPINNFEKALYLLTDHGHFVSQLFLVLCVSIFFMTGIFNIIGGSVNDGLGMLFMSAILLVAFGLLFDSNEFTLNNKKIDKKIKSKINQFNKLGDVFLPTDN